MTPEAKQKLQTAAKSAGRTVREFVLESALVRADETLANRTRFGLDAVRWKMFLEAPALDRKWAETIWPDPIG